MRTTQHGINEPIVIEFWYDGNVDELVSDKNNFNISRCGVILTPHSVYMETQFKFIIYLSEFIAIPIDISHYHRNRVCGKVKMHLEFGGN